MKLGRFLRSLAGLILGTLVSLTILSLSMSGMTATSEGFFVDLLKVVFVGFLFAAMLTVPLGLLMHFGLYALRLHGLIAYAVAGAIGGALYGGAIAIQGEVRPFDLLIYAAMGMACASVAWLIRRPDKDAARVQP